jgi:hypothetical protein
MARRCMQESLNIMTIYRYIPRTPYLVNCLHHDRFEKQKPGIEWAGSDLDTKITCLPMAVTVTAAAVTNYRRGRN